jgi:hypothetical protein
MLRNRREMKNAPPPRIPNKLAGRSMIGMRMEQE